MSQNLVHSFNSMGSGFTEVKLPIGDYSLRSTVGDTGLTVSDVAGTVVRTGPGDFKTALDGVFTITYGKQPKAIELWKVSP